MSPAHPTEILFQQLAQAAQKDDCQFLVIGGHAVNAYGYSRTTLDLDFLVAVDAFPRCQALLEAVGYRWVGQTSSFARLHPPATDPPSLPVDVMLVDSGTFAKIRDAARMLPFGQFSLPVPSPLHLIALKLHALRNPERRQLGKDMADILGLISVCQIDPQSREFLEILDRYADTTTRQLLLQQLG